MEYTKMAQYYDELYDYKEYDKEVAFLNSILKGKSNVLDVGCGTGNHIKELERFGYKCDGIDKSKEMVEITKSKISGQVYLGDMLNFKIRKKYDAIISMFAVINHLNSINELEMVLLNMKNHLRENGIIILDLYNPSKSGNKTDQKGNIKRIMNWEIDLNNKTEKTNIKYIINEEDVVETNHCFKIFDIDEISIVAKNIGLDIISIYSNYKTEEENLNEKRIQLLISRDNHN
ncbi:MAG: class I SAM-dependent methyltransferase [Clostridia bacterium]|jgi:SAM-dependent methyltransferase|nr:class I SAM-dependent methyltransferase [Clostridia bacterium]